MPLYMNGDNCSVFSKLKVEGGISGGGSIIPDNVPVSTIEVVNKTGEVVNEGDKVWLNKNIMDIESQLTSLSGATDNKMGYIDRTGIWFWAYDNYYSYPLDGTESTKIGSFTGDSYNLSYPNAYLKYGPNGSMFIEGARCDNQAHYKLNVDGPLYIGENLVKTSYYNRWSYLEIRSFDLDTGAILKSWKTNISPATDSTINHTIALHMEKPTCVWIGSGYIYNFELNDDETVNYLSSYALNEGVRLFPIGVTLDNKYIIGVDSQPQYTVNNSNSNGRLRIIDITDINNAHVLTQEEMPEDLQKYYTMICCVTFNPYTGIIACSEYDGTNYTIQKYTSEKGFENITVDLGEITALRGPITFSDDMMRVAYSENSGSTCTTYFKTLKANDGYSSVPYRYYNITKDTITGKAMTSAELDRTFTVATVL